MRFSEQLVVGDRVMLTKEGAKGHRNYSQTLAVGGGAAAVAVALPAALPGGIAAGIGIASAGTGIGVGVGAQAAAGAAAGGWRWQSSRRSLSLPRSQRRWKDSREERTLVGAVRI